MTSKDAIRLQDNLKGEIEGAALYDALAGAEPDAKIAEVYRHLAAIERAHAEFWTKQMARKGIAPRPVRLGIRTRLMVFFAKTFGTDLLMPIIARSEAKDSAKYDTQEDAVAAGLPGDEHGHARIIQTVVARSGGLPGRTLSQLQGRHGGGGNALRAAVLGSNDGLVSNLSLVMGMAGAAASGKTILLTGLAGLVAGACSMAMGEWLSVNSAREMGQAQIADQATELRQTPDQQKEELFLIYLAKGLEDKQARALADMLFANKGVALETLVREELGLDPEELGGSAWTAAISSFGLFAFGAIFPVAPFLFLQGTVAVVASIALSGLALMTIGGVTSLFTGRGLLLSATRQLLIGYIAAAITFGVGELIGVTVS